MKPIIEQADLPADIFIHKKTSWCKSKTCGSSKPGFLFSGGDYTFKQSSFIFTAGGLLFMDDQKNRSGFKDIGTLLFRSGKAVRIINLITLYRTITFPLLIFFVLTGKTDVFKWMLLASFLTDAIDGFLARKYKANSILGAKLDSIGDDLTILAATIGLFVCRWEFIREQAAIFIFLFGLFLVQFILSMIRYGKISTFHTYLAKTAAIVTAAFMLSAFFLGRIYYPLFYVAAFITGIELMEEIILAAIVRDYRTNVKGLYWVVRERGKKV